MSDKKQVPNSLISPKLIVLLEQIEMLISLAESKERPQNDGDLGGD